MIAVHGLCFVTLAIVESPKIVSYLECRKWNLTWIETVVRYVNVPLSQGLFFMLTHFFLYSIKPKKMDGSDSAIGHFATLDPFDLLMMFDIMLYICTLTSLTVFIVRATFEDTSFEEFVKLEQERVENKEVAGDFLSSNFMFKRRLTAMSSNAFLSIYILYLILTDEYQKAYKFQYVLALLEIVFVVLIYLTAETR